MNKSYRRTVLSCLIVLGSMGCSDLDQNLPAGVENPKVVDSEFGAVSLYRGVMASFSRKYSEYILYTAQFTDELQDASQSLVPYAGAVVRTLDGRGANHERSYSGLHVVRNSADQAIAMLHKHGKGRYDHLISELYSVKAFSILYLSEFYCSGIPLSTIDFDDHYTYTRGYSSTEMWDIVGHIFDSAVSFSGDSLTLKLLASVGKARTKMNMGLYTDAKQILDSVVVSGVYSYNLPHSTVDSYLLLYLRSNTVPRKEGVNGLDFRVSDPRVRYVFSEISAFTGDSIFSAIKYQLLGNNPTFVVASMIEAWLILAEIKLIAGDDEWVDILNSLRTDGTYTLNTSGDTVWNKGMGDVAGLRPLSKPHGYSQAVDLLFRERAFWLYLTGHRQGDLRRLIRQYERDPDSVYPTGLYGISGATFNSRYGDLVVMQPPVAESDRNPLYTGCISNEA